MTLSYLQRSLLKPILYFVVTCIVFYFSFIKLDDLLESMNKKLDVQQNKVESLYQEVHIMIEKIELIKQYNGRFKQLVEKGIVGEKNRANWIDNMMEAINRYDVDDASIQFSARTTFQPQQLGVFVDNKLAHYEQITFNGNFQHEMDFILFMNYLTEKVHALTLVHGCSLKLLNENTQSINDGLQFRADTGNINANCQFSFVEVLPYDGTLTEVKQ